MTLYKGTLHGSGEPFIVEAAFEPGDFGSVPTGGLEVIVPGPGTPTRDEIFVSIGMTGNRLVSFDAPLVCSTDLGGAVVALSGKTAQDAVKTLWTGKRCLRRWPDSLPLAPLSADATQPPGDATQPPGDATQPPGDTTQPPTTPASPVAPR